MSNNHKDRTHCRRKVGWGAIVLHRLSLSWELVRVCGRSLCPYLSLSIPKSCQRSRTKRDALRFFLEESVHQLGTGCRPERVPISEATLPGIKDASPAGVQGTTCALSSTQPQFFFLILVCVWYICVRGYVKQRQRTTAGALSLSTLFPWVRVPHWVWS